MYPMGRVAHGGEVRSCGGLVEEVVGLNRALRLIAYTAHGFGVGHYFARHNPGDGRGRAFNATREFRHAQFFLFKVIAQLHKADSCMVCNRLSSHVAWPLLVVLQK